jgi:hypothetical protein
MDFKRKPGVLAWVAWLEGTRSLQSCHFTPLSEQSMPRVVPSATNSAGVKGWELLQGTFSARRQCQFRENSRRFKSNCHGDGRSPRKQENSCCRQVTDDLTVARTSSVRGYMPGLLWDRLPLLLHIAHC